MRVHIGVVMPKKGGRSAIVGVEVFERPAQGRRRLGHEFVVGLVERVSPATIEATRGRVWELAAGMAGIRPCVFIDTGTAQGLTLRRMMRDDMPEGLHRPHAFPGTGDRQPLFAAFLQAYADGAVRFEPGLGTARAELDKALVLYMGGGIRKDGAELKSEDEALVVALGLALYWPRHGPTADVVKDRGLAADLAGAPLKGSAEG